MTGWAQIENRFVAATSVADKVTTVRGCSPGGFKMLVTGGPDNVAIMV